MGETRSPGGEETYPTMTPELFEFFLNIFPPCPKWEDSENETERKFKEICGMVKRLYPGHCKTTEEWVKTAHHLTFYDFLKTLMDNPKIYTPARERALSWLFDRFSLAIDRAEEENRRIKQVAC